MKVIDDVRRDGRVWLSEPEAKAVLEHAGIAIPPGRLARTVEDLDAVSQDLQTAVALKMVSPDILHKTEVGGVVVNVRGNQEVQRVGRALFDRARQAAWHVTGILVEDMVIDGQEFVVGGFHDPRFGPVVMVGLGGIYVELFSDVAFGICPLTEPDADDMIGSLRASPLLEGWRGRPALSRSALVDVLLKVGGATGLLLQYPLAELDINPLIVTPSRAVAVDARIGLRKEADSQL